MLWDHDSTSSGIGNSSAAVAERGSYDQEEEKPVERRNLQQFRRAALVPAKPSDEVKPTQCHFCGLPPIALSLPHRSAFDCVQDLRARLGEKELRAWTGPPARRSEEVVAAQALKGP